MNCKLMSLLDEMPNVSIMLVDVFIQVSENMRFSNEISFATGGVLNRVLILTGFMVVWIDEMS